MKASRPRLRALLLLVATSLTLAGCPLTLEDDFKIAPPASGASASAGGGDAGSGGQGNRGGMNMPTAGSGATAGDSVVGPGGEGGSTTMPPEAGAGGLGEGGMPPIPPCAECTPEECCNGHCVNLELNPNHCSECNKGCPGTTCDNASCTNVCAQGFLDCNHNVVDGCEINPAIDPQNCGNCEVDCGFQFECQAGYCVCPTGTADCDGDKDNGCEVDTTSDKASCGGCGKACGANQACVTGACGCELGFDDCNGVADDGCEADLTSTVTCGSCDLDCGQYSACLMAGQCGCDPTHLNCDDQIAGCETPLTDPDHCGDCDTICPAQTPVCDGVTCVSGCGALTRCGDSCVDTLIDPAHCGDCNQPVGLNQICEGGQPVCVGGYDDCDSDPTTCETNTQTDLLNCGACGDPCKSGAVCNAGSCECAPSTPNDCGASCEQCCDATQCSDGDPCTVNSCTGGVCSYGAECEAGSDICCSGTGCFECCSDGDCAVGKMCSSNQCVNLVCTLPQVICNLKCVNPETDPDNCGACGNDCGPGRTCSGSTCTPKWVPTAAAPVSFVAREKAAYAAMGSKVFIWGGNNAAGQALSDGAVYDPATDTWTTIATAGAPSARVLATAVWTGTVVVVWAGGDVGNNTDYSSGSRYDPSTNTWAATTNTGAPSGRRAPHGFWTGTRVMYYAGNDRQGTALSAPYLYDPVNDVWSNTTGTNRPPGYSDRTVGWTGSLLIAYGGRNGGNTNGIDDTHTYDLALDDWNQEENGPSNRYGAMGTWDGTYLIAWSGMGSSIRTDGRMYNPMTDAWTVMGTTDDPTYRYAIHRQTGWVSRLKPRVTLMVGGFNSANGFLVDGGIYNSTTNAWTAVAGWPSAASHLWGVGVWTGTEFVVWSGRLGTTSTLTAAGDRYFP